MRGHAAGRSGPDNDGVVRSFKVNFFLGGRRHA